MATGLHRRIINVIGVALAGLVLLLLVVGTILIVPSAVMSTYDEYQFFSTVRENPIKVMGEINNSKIEYRDLDDTDLDNISNFIRAVKDLRFVVVNFKYQIDSVEYVSGYYAADALIYTSNTLWDIHNGYINKKDLPLQPFYVNPAEPELLLTYDPTGTTFIHHLRRTGYLWVLLVIGSLLIFVLFVRLWYLVRKKRRNAQPASIEERLKAFKEKKRTGNIVADKKQDSFNGFAYANKINEYNKTTFNLLLFIFYAMFFVFDIFLVRFYLREFIQDPSVNIYAFYSFTFIVVLCVSFVIVYPFVKMYSVEIAGGNIVYKWILLPIVKTFETSKIDGYYAIKIRSKYSEYLTYYLTSNEKTLPSISSYIYANSEEFIKTTGIKYLGHIPFSWKFYFYQLLFLRRIPKNYLSNLDQENSIKK